MDKAPSTPNTSLVDHLNEADAEFCGAMSMLHAILSIAEAMEDGVSTGETKVSYSLLMAIEACAQNGLNAHKAGAAALAEVSKEVANA